MKKLMACLLVISIAFLASACSSQDMSKLTLETVIELAQKGEDLSWSDFEGYEAREIGSGLYILKYEIEDNFYLLIGGEKEKQPMYIRLQYDTDQDGFVDNDDYIDIRSESVKEFIEKHGAN